MMSAARFFWQAALDFIYPPLCLVCDRYLPDDEPLMHTACLAGLPLLDVEDLSGAPLAAALRYPPWFERSLALHPYSDALQRLVHHLKYKGLHTLAVPLGRSLGQLISDLDYAQQLEALIPVPLHRSRQRERGYNQSFLLAAAASAICDIPVRDRVLVRRRATSPQARMRRRERQKNLAGAFCVKEPFDLQGAAVGLVDDVLTTGHTANECARTLLEAGAGRVVIVTIARVV